MSFKSGDVVQLKSGGPQMTVNAVISNETDGDIVECVWYGDNRMMWIVKLYSTALKDENES